jgi:periplasmic protein TonB
MRGHTDSSSTPLPPAVRQDRLQGYPRRLMISLAVTLILMIGVVHIPASFELGRIGWIMQPTPIAPLEIMQPVVATHEGLITRSPITDAGLREDASPQDDQEIEEVMAEEVASELPRSADSRRLDSHRILSFADEQPQIVGGLAGYYLNIEYPEAAREAGVQGRLLLSFVVERDGRVTDIRVDSGLHPLCDSAAVQALRRSRFIAGRQNGETVRVRMRLPVRFMLLDEPPPPTVVTKVDVQNPGS